MPASSLLRYPTDEQIRSQILSDIFYGFAKIGVRANVAVNSELWHRAGAFAKRVSVAIANGKLGLQAVDPLRAQGQDLFDLAGVFGVTPRPASAASGFVACKVLPPAASLLVTAGYACTSARGIQYAVTADTTVATGGLAPMLATTAGKRTDLAAGAIVTWNSAAIGFLDQKAIVAAGGLDGGQEADDVEVVRQRLLRKLGFPSVGGNWSQVAEWAASASAAIRFVAVYPTMRGPGSYDVAIVGDDAAPVLNPTVQSRAASAIIAEHPGHVSLNVTSEDLELVDVVINLGVPLPKLAGGAGGGWVDAAPWPSTAEATVRAKITAHNFATLPGTITVNSTSADAPRWNQRVAIWDYAAKDADGNAAPRFRFFTILGVTGASGAYVLRLDAAAQSAVSFIEDGMYVSPGADRLQAYADSFFTSVTELGPGEKTDDPDLLAYARRKPGPEIERPYNLTSRQLDSIENDNAEVSDVSYAARYATGTANTKTSPSVPIVVSAAPRKLALKHLAFRRQT